MDINAELEKAGLVNTIVLELLKNNQMVLAIKLIKQVYPSSLVQAKQFVDALEIAQRKAEGGE